jgi:hypothetical protein
VFLKAKKWVERALTLLEGEESGWGRGVSRELGEKI